MSNVPNTQVTVDSLTESGLSQTYIDKIKPVGMVRTNAKGEAANGETCTAINGNKFFSYLHS